MDRFLVRSSSNSNLAKRQADESASAVRTAKRLAFARSVDKGRPQSIFHKNSFEPLQTDVDTDADSDILDNAATATLKKTSHIPPIVLKIEKEFTHQKIKDLISKYTSTFHLQYRGKGQVSIICHTAEAHKVLKEGLRKEDIHFLTYSRKDERTPKLVMRGLPGCLHEQLSAELASMGFQDSTVTVMKTKTAVECPPFLIKLAPGSDVKKFRQIKYVFNCVVSIARYRPNQTLGTQCYRCQAFGHSSKNCNMPPRCIKCINHHPIGECPKKDRTEHAKCVNCNEDHPANFRECSVRLAYLKRIRDNQENQRKPRIAATYVPGRTWASVTRQDSLTKKPPTPKGTVSLFAEDFQTERKSAVSPLQNKSVGCSSTTKINSHHEIPSSDNDGITKEILTILTAVRELKSKFVACKSLLDKVMLVLTHLGHCV